MEPNKTNLKNWIADFITLMLSLLLILIMCAVASWFVGFLIGTICKLFLHGYNLWW